MRTWYITADRAPVVWATAVIAGIAQHAIYRMVDAPGTDNDPVYVWARQGGKVTAHDLAAAKAEASSDAVPTYTAPAPSPSGGDSGTGSGGSAAPAGVTAARLNALRAPVQGAAISARAIGRSNTATSTALVQTTRVRHVITEPGVGAHLFFTGWGNGEAAQPVDATIKAAIEFGGVIHPVTFGGARTATLVAGGTLRSDTLGLNLRKGDVVWVRAARTIASGAWLANCALLGTTSGEGSADADVVDSASTAFTVPASDTGTAWSAHALVSAGTSAARSVAFMGDSLSNGQNESVRELGGYMLRCLPDNVGVIRANAGGGTVKEFVNNTLSGSSGRRRLSVAVSAKYAWVEYGINDVNGGDTAEVICANLLKLWTALADAGLVVCQSTITLWAGGSTDGYQTVEGQGVWAKNGVRTAVNDFIRSKPAPLSHVFEMADVVESSRNSGKWKAAVGGVALCSDGIHPSTLGHQLIADALRTQAAAVFV